MSCTRTHTLIALDFTDKMEVYHLFCTVVVTISNYAVHICTPNLLKLVWGKVGRSVSTRAIKEITCTVQRRLLIINVERYKPDFLCFINLQLHSWTHNTNIYTCIICCECTGCTHPHISILHMNVKSVLHSYLNTQYTIDILHIYGIYWIA